jgi:hypothetical protein
VLGFLLGARAGELGGFAAGERHAVVGAGVLGLAGQGGAFVLDL